MSHSVKILILKEDNSFDQVLKYFLSFHTIYDFLLMLKGTNGGMVIHI